MPYDNGFCFDDYCFDDYCVLEGDYVPTKEDLEAYNEDMMNMPADDYSDEELVDMANRYESSSVEAPF